MRCPFCGDKEQIGLAEIWADGSFQLETCCEGMHEFLCQANTPEDWKTMLESLHVEDLTGRRLRRVVDTDAGLLLDYQLRVAPVAQARAKDFVRAHHAHSPNPPAGWRYGAAIWNGYTMLGVVMVGRPVARMIDHQTTCEINRLCLRRDLPGELAWNACSQLYGWAAREAKRRKFRKVITYTLAREAGTSLRAAGFTPERVSAGGTWSCPSRRRIDKHSTEPKVRWARTL